ncbi:N-acetyltransferase [Magnetovibrio sp. PR-2]|uniref:GNAT family N-acetyltransferase n=1 Tax=Magnetovibrio sp. PR-2 TaxID=3120356 RepID=UPI002FCE3751
MEIREELDHERQGVFAVMIATFGGTDEAKLVESLDNDGSVISSLVAVEYGEIVAHILFSAVQMASDDGETLFRAAALFPLCVAPTHQRMGIGSELVRQGLEICQKKDVDAVLALGQENFFARLGFSTWKAENLKSPFSPGFLSILSLNPSILDDFSGKLVFPPTFG